MRMRANYSDLSVSVEDDESDEPLFPHRRESRSFENREFVAWDGEGITFPGETQQCYVLFGNSSGFSLSSRSLGTRECLDLMLETEKHNPLAIHVGFAFSYDVEMILKDLTIGHMRKLKRDGFVWWQDYRISFRKSKWFMVTKNKVTCKIWDVFSFFSTSFVVALQEYLPACDEIEFIAKGKASRKLFTYDEMESVIIPYWQSELRQMVLLMQSLRTRLYKADLKIVNWHGPGAIATYAMKKNGIKTAMNRETPDAVKEASRFAFAGGRFELFRIGYHHENAYSYDIRSAYPSAIRHLPNLNTGTWNHVSGPQKVMPFGIYKISFVTPDIFSVKPMPFFYRDEMSNQHYPHVVTGWYWSPEASMTQFLGSNAIILEAWVYDATDDRPFEWVEDTYELRAQWKRDNDPAQIALKLLLNSMFGKFAQRVGWTKDGAPSWHQLEWAGYITSHCRATLFGAMMEAHQKGALIAVETDGIFTSEPLTSLTVGEKLGQWEAETYEELIYLQSGFCFKKQNGKWKTRTRGFDKDSITLENAIAALGKWRPWQDDAPLGSILGTSTRFTSMGQYLQYPNPEPWRRTWNTTVRELQLGSDGKRVHRPLACSACSQGISPVDVMHDLTIYKPIGGHTFPHILPWIDLVINQEPNTHRVMKEMDLL